MAMHAVNSRGVIDKISAGDKAYIATLAENNHGYLHFSLGLGIRNEMRLGGLQALRRWTDELGIPAIAIDNKSGKIIDEIIRTVKAEGPLKTGDS